MEKIEVGKYVEILQIFMICQRQMEKTFHFSDMECCNWRGMTIAGGGNTLLLEFWEYSARSGHDQSFPSLRRSFLRSAACRLASNLRRWEALVGFVFRLAFGTVAARRTNATNFSKHNSRFCS